MENVGNDTTEGEKKIFGLNRELLPCKLLDFTLRASMTSLFSFTTLFYVSSGLTPAKVGLSSGICSGVLMVTGPIWGGIVDATKRKMLLLISLSLTTTSLEFCKPFVIYYVSKTKMICLEGNTTVDSNSSVESVRTNCTRSVQLLNPDELFIAITVNSILSSIFMAGLLSYIEGVICKTVFTRQTKPAYGEQKVFGPIGSAVGSVIAGVAVDHYKPKHLSHYTAAFYVYLPLSLMVIPILWKITKQAKWDHGKRNDKGPLKKRLIGVLKKKDNIVLFISAFLGGISANMYGHFILLFMRDTMNPSKTVMSLTTVVAMMSEVIIYPFASRIIRKCGGPIPCVIAGIAAYSLRLLLLSYSTKAWNIFPLQLLHGISTCLIATAMVEYTYHMFPKEVTTTAIAFLFALETLVSSVIGGRLYTSYGGAVLFRWTSIMNTVLLVCMTLYFGIRYMVSKRNGICTVVESGDNQTRVVVENGKVNNVGLDEGDIA